MCFQNKFWKHIEDHLVGIENIAAYYAGGTLSLPLGVDSCGKDRWICLNLNGKGFVLSDIKNSVVYLPNHITDLVRKVYLDVKGRTEHYMEIVEGI